LLLALLQQFQSTVVLEMRMKMMMRVRVKQFQLYVVSRRR
jgi:hypothetical protein